MSNLTAVYEQIALERKRVCSGCGTTQRLSHSHLIPRSYSKKYEDVKENIQFHCLSFGIETGCHSLWESNQAPLLKDFIDNMIYIFKTDQTYYWKKFYKMEEHWTKFDDDVSPKAKAALKLLSERVQLIELGMI